MTENEMIQTLLESLTLANAPWDAWELEFIESLNGKTWGHLSAKQQAVVLRLYDAL